MSVLVDQRASASAQSSLANGSTFSTTNQTITAALANGGLLVCVVDNSTGTSFQVNWDTGGSNQLMTSCGTLAISGQNLFFFGLANPTSGNKTLGVKRTSGATAQVDVYSVSLSGTDQNVSNWAVHITTASGAGTAVSLIESCPPGSYAFSVVAALTATITANVGPTLRFGTDSLTSPATTVAGGDSSPGSTTSSHSWTLSVSDTFAGILISVPPTPTPWFDGISVGAGASPEMSLRKPPKQAFSALSGGDEGIARPYVRWRNVGWEIQPPQPPHRGNERKAGAIMPKEDGIEAKFIRFLPFGFENQPPQPPHPRRERFGAIVPKEDGIEAAFKFVALPGTQAGFEPTLPILPNQSRLLPRLAATKGRSEFAIFNPWLNFGFEVQSVQPPNPGMNNIARNNIRFAATIGGDSGIEAPFIPPAVPTWGFEFTFQPPYQRRKLSTAIEDGAEGVYTKWQNFGWEVQSPQPPNPWTANLGQNNVRSAALVGGDSGIEARLINFFPAGWEVQSVQPPHPRSERSGALAIGDSGIENKFVATFTTSGWGFDAQPYQPQRIPRPSAAIARGDDGIELPLINFFPAGWEVQSVQSPHRRVERAGALAVGDAGIENVLATQAPVTSGWGFDPVLPIFSIEPKIANRAGAIKGKSEFAIFPQWSNFGWEVQAPQPPHPRPERFGSIVSGDGGNEAPFIPPVANLPPYGFEFQWQPPNPFTTNLGRNNVRFAALVGGDPGIELPKINFFPFGWEVQPPQPRHPRAEKSGSIMVGDSGIEAAYVFAGSNLAPYPIDQTNVTLRPNPTPMRGQAAFGTSEFFAFSLIPWIDDPQGHWKRTPRRTFDPGFAGIEGKFVPPSNVTSGWGFDPQPIQPQPKFFRSGALVRSDDGAELPLINFFNFGWPIASHQPGHPRPERSGAIMAGDPGNEGVFQFVSLVLAPWGFQPWEPQPPHPRPERGAAIMPSEDGSEFPKINFFPHGWPVAPHQPAHPRPEKSGALAIGDSGIEFPLQAPPVLAPYMIDLPYLLRYKRGIDAAMMWNQDPPQPLTRFFPAGWEVAPVQPPHPRPERSGSIAAGDTGIEAKFIPPPTPTWGFEPIPMHIRVPYNRGGAILRGEEGVEAPYVRWIVRGWDQTESTQRGRPRVFGAIQSGFPIEGVYVFVPLPVFLYTQNADGVILKRKVNVGAAMPFEVGWNLPRLPSTAVFYATSVLSQGTGATTVSAASAQTVVKAEPVGR
jgi:hypothetical protein